MMKRRTRDVCIEDVGKKQFCFDAKKEFVKYKCVCGEELGEKEWGLLTCCERHTSKCIWEKEIINKYQDQNSETLYEFSEHLKHQERRLGALGKSSDIIMPAIVSTIVSVLFNCIINIGQDNLEWNNFVNIVTNIVLFVLCLLVYSAFLAVSLIIVIKEIYINAKKEDLYMYFLIDYRKVINTILDERKMVVNRKIEDEFLYEWRNNYE